MYWTATDKGLLFPGYVLRLLEGSNSLTPRRQVVLDILLPSKVCAGLAFSEIARAKPIKYLTSAWKLPHCEIASDFCYVVIFRGQMWLEKCLNFCKIWLFRRVPDLQTSSMLFFLRYGIKFNKMLYLCKFQCSLISGVRCAKTRPKLKFLKKIFFAGVL